MKRYTGTIPAIVRVEFYAENEADARENLLEIGNHTSVSIDYGFGLTGKLETLVNQREVIESEYA